jgi:hypothetical protein
MKQGLCKPGQLKQSLSLGLFLSSLQSLVLGDTQFGEYGEPTAQSLSWHDVKSEVLGVSQLLLGAQHPGSSRKRETRGNRDSGGSLFLLCESWSPIAVLWLDRAIIPLPGIQLLLKEKCTWLLGTMCGFHVGCVEQPVLTKRIS